MNIRAKSGVLLIGALLVAGCGNGGGEPVVESAPEVDKSMPEAGGKLQPAYDGDVAKPGSPFAIRYRIVGTPIVGSPVAIDLRVESARDSRPINVRYRINDETAMMLHEAQPAEIRMEPAANENFIEQRVTVVPMREGRLYLNVGASLDDENGSASTVIAIPIQVGEGEREMQEHGELATDEEGESVRVLTSEE